MLNKLMSKFKPAEKIGSKTKEATEVTGTSHLEQTAYITFSELNGGISEPILSKLTIGSELGELVIEDDSISPRHCTFIKNGEVICVIDHSSTKGTFLNKKRLEPGRTFIINTNDKLKIGDYKAYIEFLDVPVEGEDFEDDESNSNQTPSIEESFEQISTPELDVPEVKESHTSVTNLMQRLNEDTNGNESHPAGEKSLEELFEDDSDQGNLHELEDPNDINSVDVEEVELDPSVLRAEEDIVPEDTSRIYKLRKKKNNKNKVKLSSKSKLPAANILFRFFGLSIDVLICWSLINIFYVFIDFQNFYNDTPLVIKEVLNEPYQDYIKVHVESILKIDPALDGVVKDILNYSELSSVFSFIFFVFLVRFISTLIFSVSIGQYLIGIRSLGHSLWKRLLGSVREFFGLITFPFILFDIPTFIGKRSFKEVVTKTHIYNFSGIGSTLLIIFFVPIFLLAGTLSPMLKGLELLPAIKVEENNLKLKPWQYKNKVYSQLLDIQYDLSGHITTLPAFHIELKNKKRFLTLGLLFLDKENGNSFELKKTKEFSMPSIYEDFVKLNLFSEYFFPHIEGHVKDVSNKNSNFKRKNNKSFQLLDETQRILKDSFTLSFHTLNEFIINNGPSVAGHRDFREKIESLVSKKIRNIILLSFGRTRGAFFSHIIGKRVFYSYLPLNIERGQLFQVSEDVSDKSFRLIADHIVIGRSNDEQVGKDPIAEFTHGFKMDSGFENFDLAQAVYDRYFNIVGHFMREKDDKTLMKLQDNIRNLLEVLRENKLKNVKLMLNLTELLEAIKKQDDEFFNIKRTVTV